MSKVLGLFLVVFMLCAAYIHYNYDISIYDKGKRPSAECLVRCEFSAMNVNHPIPQKGVQRRGEITTDDWDYFTPQTFVVAYTAICMPADEMRRAMYEMGQIDLFWGVHMSFDFDNHYEFSDGRLRIYDDGGFKHTIVHYREDGTACTLSKGTGLIGVHEKERYDPKNDPVIRSDEDA